jgi:uncharacterized protein YjbI with pentapeptide repeats
LRTGRLDTPYGANLSRANLKSADLGGARLDGANLSLADLSESDEFVYRALFAARKVRPAQLDRACGQPAALPAGFPSDFRLAECPPDWETTRQRRAKHADLP